MKAAAAVILYKPEEIGSDAVASNIRSYAPYFGTIYVVDNSPEETAAGWEIVSKLMMGGGYCLPVQRQQRRNCRRAEQSLPTGNQGRLRMDYDNGPGLFF